MENVAFPFLIVIILCAYGMVAEIVVKPRDTVAVAGQLTYLNCSIRDPTKDISWFYDAVSSFTSVPTDIYQLGSLQGSYVSRAKVEKDSVTGAFNLVLNQVQRSDAGKYTCQEDGEQPQYSSAELVVLDSSPTCASNINGNKVIGTNPCGLETEQILLSCYANYIGNIPPKFKWRSNDKDNIVVGVKSKDSGSNITSEFSVPGSMSKSRHFICETEGGAQEQYSCSSGAITAVEFSNNLLITQKKVGEEASCLAKTSQPCTYKWILYDDAHEYNVSTNPGVTLQKPGTYRCEAECTIKEKHCSIIAGLLLVTDDDGSEKCGVVCSLLIVIIVALLVLSAIGLIIILIWKRPWERLRRRRSETGENSQKSHDDKTVNTVPADDDHGQRSEIPCRQDPDPTSDMLNAYGIIPTATGGPLPVESTQGKSPPPKEEIGIDIAGKRASFKKGPVEICTEQEEDKEEEDSDEEEDVEEDGSLLKKDNSAESDGSKKCGTSVAVEDPEENPNPLEVRAKKGRGACPDQSTSATPDTQSDTNQLKDFQRLPDANKYHFLETS